MANIIHIDRVNNAIELELLTASRLLALSATNVVQNTDLNSWVAGTANEIDVTDDADGTITIGIVNPLIVGKGGSGAATFTDGGILLGSGTDAFTALGQATNGQIPIGSTGADPVLATITGTTNQITSTPGAGTITLSLPQDIHTGASPTFAALTVDSPTLCVNLPSYTDKVGIGTATPSQALDLIGSLELEDTTTSTTGVIYKGANRFLHNFHHPTGNTAIPVGYNTFIGEDAGNFTTGSTATAVFHASNNTGIAHNALQSLTTGFNNTALGTFSLQYNTTGSNNFGMGKGALNYNTSGGSNTAVGTNALNRTVTTSYNTAIGAYAGQGVASNSFSNNSLFGTYSGYLLTTGSNNLFLGYLSGYNQTTNSNLLIIDNQDRTTVALELTNSLIYGVFAAAPANQTLRINGVLTPSQGIVMLDGGTVGQAAGPLLNFDDTNDYLEITGCSVGIGTATPTYAGGLHVWRNDSAEPLIFAQNNTAKAVVRIQTNANDGAQLDFYTNGNRNWSIGPGISIANIFEFRDETASALRMYIDAAGALNFVAGSNIVSATTTGTKIGTATNQLLGFYGAIPVDQPATVADPTGGTADAEARTAINAIIDRLQELGLIA